MYFLTCLLKNEDKNLIFVHAKEDIVVNLISEEEPRNQEFWYKFKFLVAHLMHMPGKIRRPWPDLRLWVLIWTRTMSETQREGPRGWASDDLVSTSNKIYSFFLSCPSYSRPS